MIKDFVVWYGKLSPKLNGVQQAIYAWNNVEILVKAIEKAGKAEPAAIVEAMESGMPIETVGGTFTYSASDHTGLPLSALGMAQGGARISANGTWVAAPGLLR
jgi:ABC-type branched-subunit amino acid transport system substrate-binding protein